MGAHTGNVLVAEARDALETDRDVHLLIAGLPQWLKVEVLSGMRNDVNSIQAQVDDSSRMVFRKDALTAVRITEKRKGTSVEFVG